MQPFLTKNIFIPLEVFQYQVMNPKKSRVIKSSGFFGSIISVVGKSTVEIMEPFLV